MEEWQRRAHFAFGVDKIQVTWLSEKPKSPYMVAIIAAETRESRGVCLEARQRQNRHRRAEEDLTVTEACLAAKRHADV